MFTLIITAVLAFHGSSVNVHSIDFDNKQACEIAAKEWKSRANSHSFAFCVSKK